MTSSMQRRVLKVGNGDIRGTGLEGCSPYRSRSSFSRRKSRFIRKNACFPPMLSLFPLSHTLQPNTIGCIHRHAGNPSFPDLQTCTQKPCADSSSMGCNGAVTSSESILPPSVPAPSNSPFSLTRSLSLAPSLPPPQMKTGPHRGCQHLIGWEWMEAGARHREREKAQEATTTQPQHPYRALS